MFVSLYNKVKEETHMDRMSMDGTGRTHIAEDGMLGPVVLHFDSHFHRLFLADAGTGDMEHLSTDGKCCQDYYHPEDEIYSNLPHLLVA